jgi:phospholipase D1/2
VLRAPAPGADPWPPGLVPDLAHVPVGIARTEPLFDGESGAREVAALWRDGIAAARRWLYVENQYLTARCLEEALVARLEAADGPEVVMVLPHTCSGWLEERTMGVLRARLLRRLRRADRHGRLRVFHPVIPGPAGVRLNVHAKVLVADDTLLRVGSSNMSNRSMGLDTECDLAIDAAGDGAVECAVAGLRDRLLAEHLGVSAARVAREIAARGSLIAAVEALRGGPRTLVPLDDEPPEWFEPALRHASIVDLERPVESRLPEDVVPRHLGEPPHRPLLRTGIVVAALLLIAVAWRWTGLGDRLAPSRLAAVAAPLRGSLVAPVAVLGAYLLGSAVMAPITVLVFATVLVFGPWLGAAYALFGGVVTAVATYVVGRTVWPDALGRLPGRWVRSLRRRLERRGVLAVTVVRLVPLAPFTIVNLVAGAVPVRFHHFLLGSVLGLVPGILTIALLGRAVGL